MPKIPRPVRTTPAFWASGKFILGLFIVGAALAIGVPGDIYRGWFALMAFLFSLTFVLVYSRRNWRSSFAGRASMLSMSMTTLYTANLVLILWWPDVEYGYPHWASASEIIYLGLALAALYKLAALEQAKYPAPGEMADSTVGPSH